MAKQSIFAYLGLNTDEFKKGIGKAKGQMSGFEKTGQAFAKNMAGIFAGAFAVDALITFGKESVAAFDEQEKSYAKVSQAVSQTGGAAKKTAQELFDMASGLQEITIFGDETILNDVTAQLLTFTNIAGDQFDKAQVAALDLATVLGTDLKSVSIQLGKALNDPVQGINALTRSGVSFTQSQKNVIKSLVASGDIAKAQTLILDELNRQYGGQAEAAAASGAGRLQQLANAWGDIKEVIGKELMAAINSILDSFGDLWDVLKDLFAPIGELFGAFEGLNGEFSVGAMLGDVLTMSIKAMTMMFKPMVWIVQKVAEGFKYLYENSEFFRQAIDVIKGSINAIVKVFNNLGAIMMAVSNSFGHLWEAIKTMNFDGLGGKISGEFKKAFETKPIEKHEEAVKQQTVTVKEQTKEQIKALEERNKKLKETYEAAEKANKRLAAGFGVEGGDIEVDLSNVQVKEKENLFDFSDMEMPSTDEVLGSEFDKVNEKAEALRKGLKDQTTAINEMFKTIAIDGLATFGAALGTAFAGGDVMAIGMQFAQAVADSIGMLGKQLIQIGFEMMMIQEALTKFGWTNPALVIGGGIALVALSSAMKGMMGNSVGFADGGLVTGSVFANIGEGIGTNSANPEVIAPLDKLKNFIAPNENAGMGGNVSFRIEGNTLVGILDRQAKTTKYGR